MNLHKLNCYLGLGFSVFFFAAYVVVLANTGSFRRPAETPLRFEIQTHEGAALHVQDGEIQPGLGSKVVEALPHVQTLRTVVVVALFLLSLCGWLAALRAAPRAAPKKT
jgi:hypothetical protein